MGIGVQVGDSSAALQKPLEISRVTIHHHSNLVSTFELLVWHVVSPIGGDYSEAIRSISSRVEHVSNVTAHTSIACIINLTPQTMPIYVCTVQCPWCDRLTTNL